MTKQVRQRRRKLAREAEESEQGDFEPITQKASKQENTEKEALKGWKAKAEVEIIREAVVESKELQPKIRTRLMGHKKASEEKRPIHEGLRLSDLEIQGRRLEERGHVIEERRNHKGGWQLKCRECLQHRPSSSRAAWNSTLSEAGSIRWQGCCRQSPHKGKKNKYTNFGNAPMSASKAPPTTGATKAPTKTPHASLFKGDKLKRQKEGHYKRLRLLVASSKSSQSYERKS